MVYDSSATRARLLDAAYDEFVSHGLAGARVDRIAKAAPANKQAIYAYFGSKDELFDAVLGARLRVLADMVPFTPSDLGAYAGALFDAFVDDPGLIRLTQWKALERPEASAGELEAHLEKAREVAEARGATLEAAMDALMIALSAAQAWLFTPPAIRNPGGADEQTRRLRHREAVVAAVGAMTDRLLPPGERSGSAGEA
ncbi:TetR/AcrR family transcriptional regulator [Actinacidiphila guanduensis]|uniref:Transcriptional regulator, TetR family n=1 Tax=Actinacidiphila guanduensis TaxID=310781 RepID=A0A1H0PZC2_9ACTN|nr:TetR family transcriptional regulator [Actinacidiphila guanduensis]SDP10085.1 transcriptional regulator, TetR family [Actinacidiphila guanduensis]